MKKRTKEENAAYSKMLRDKKRSTHVAPADLRVAPVKNVAPCVAPTVKRIAQGVAPRVGDDADKCLSCVTHLENKKLCARIALLEDEINKKISTPVYQGVDISVGENFKSRYKPLGNSYKPNSLYGA
jgi:hypothetical protein